MAAHSIGSKQSSGDRFPVVTLIPDGTIIIIIIITISVLLCYVP